MSERTEDPGRTARRMGLIIAIPGLLCGLVVAKSFQLQVVLHDQLAAEATRQQSGKTRTRPRRGTIYDRNTEVLAGSAASRSVWADPKQVADPGAAATAMGKTLGLDAAGVLSLKRRLARKDRHFTWVARHVGQELAAAVEALRIPGIKLQDETRRYWPMKESVGQVLGFVDIDDRGLEGLERAFDKDLSGTSQVLSGLRDARRRLLLSGSPEGASDGNSLVLTIDKNIQHIVEAELVKAVQTHGARSAVAVAMDPNNGDLLAVAHAPLFNPNGHKGTAADYKNRAFKDAYEPGSVMKPFTVAAALEAGLVTPRTMINTENGVYRIGRHRIRDHDRNESLNVSQIVEVSSNIGTAKIAERLGKKGLHDALRTFGFGERSGSGVPGEAAGVIHPWKRWANSTLATVSYGHGMTVTPIQLVAGLSALANGGTLYQPRLVDRVVDPDGRRVRDFPVTARRKVIKPSVSKAVVDTMLKVVEGEDGTASRARVPGFRVAGKTGTAQKVDSVAGGYVDKWVGTFMGFAPAEDPAVVLLVSLDEPEPHHYGGLVSAPAFSRMMGAILAYLEIAPDDEMALVPPPEADGPLTLDHGKPIPAISTTDDEEEVIAALGAARLPDFRGMTLRAAMVEARRLGIQLEPVGTGRARAQRPPAGSRLEAGKTDVRVNFEPVL